MELGSEGHGVDDQVLTFARDQHDDLEEVPGSVRAEHQPPFWVLADVIDHDGMLDRMADVVVRDVVTTSR